MIILIHSSKTMRSPAMPETMAYRPPQLLSQATALAEYIKTLPAEVIAKAMNVSPALAAKTAETFKAWSNEPHRQSLAIDSFAGDIYSGLQAAELTPADRDYADKTLRILSGLYGVLRPYDGIMPYRLELMYKLPDPAFRNLYQYWDDAIAGTLPDDGPIINLAAVEYAKTVTSYVASSRVVTPKFLTVSPKTGEPVFVVVHAKIARGAFARWLVQRRASDVRTLLECDALGYAYRPELSTPAEPVFVCKEFGGLGLSVRLQKP